MPEHLTEHIADWRSEIVVEKASRTIRNVALAGTKSKNGYRYSEGSLRSAAPLYENVPVFLDHPASAQRPRDRSTRDLAGSVVNVRFEGARLRGDLRTLDTEAGQTLLALAEADGPGVGMSHVVLAERSRDGATVERIVEVISVDAVAFPACTRTFRESAAAATDPAVADSGLEEGDGVRPTEPSSAGRLDHAEASALSSVIEHPVLAVPASMSGSLERSLASVDAELPRHLRRLAAAPGSPRPGRGARVGVFPRHVLVEWRAAGALPEHYAVAWRTEGDRLVLEDELIPVERLAERLGAWSDLLTPHPQEHDAENQTTIETRLGNIEQRLREIAADPMAPLVENSQPPTSVTRRPAPPHRITDDAFVRTVRKEFRG